MTDFEAVRDCKKGDNRYSFQYWAQLTDRQRGFVRRHWEHQPWEGEITTREATEVRYHKQLFEMLHCRERKNFEEVWDRMDTIEEQYEEEMNKAADGSFYWQIYD